MKLDLDLETITTSCPKCGKQLKEKLGRLKREKRIACPKCGRVAVDTDQIRRVEDAINKDLAKQLAQLNKTINIKL